MLLFFVQMTSPRLYTNEESLIQTNQYLIYDGVSILYTKERILLSGTDQTEHYGRSDIILEHFRVDGISFQTQERKGREIKKEVKTTKSTTLNFKELRA